MRRRFVYSDLRWEGEVLGPELCWYWQGGAVSNGGIAHPKMSVAKSPTDFSIPVIFAAFKGDTRLHPLFDLSNGQYSNFVLQILVE